MKEELECAISNLEKAYIKLKDGTDTATDELGKGGVIKKLVFLSLPRNDRVSQNGNFFTPSQ